MSDYFVLGFICGGLCILPIGLLMHFVWLLLRYDSYRSSERDL